jgi:hypothetical protein
VTAAEAGPDAPQVLEQEPAPKPANDAPPQTPNRSLDHNQPTLADSLIPPQAMNRVPLATGGFDAALVRASSLGLPFSTPKGLRACRR